MNNLLKYYVKELMDFDSLEFIQACAVVGAFAVLMFLSVLILG